MVSWMKREYVFALFVFLVLLCIPQVLSATAPSTASFETAYGSKIDSIYSNETAIYTVNITNNDNIEERYQFDTAIALWDISPSFPVVVEPSSMGSFDIHIRVLDNRLYGPQLVPVRIRSLSDNKAYVENLYLYLKPSNYTGMQYAPTVAMEVTADNEIDPRQPLSLTVYMRNRNPLNISELTIQVNSQLFNKEYKTILGPLEVKTNQILFADLDPHQTPGTYKVDVRLINSVGDTIAEVQKDIRVKSYADVSTEDIKTNRLFSSTETITLVNKGNYEATKQVKIEKNLFQKIFTKTNIDYYSSTENGVSYIQWDVQLLPNQKYVITATTNYTWLVIVLLLILIGTISYYIFRSPILLFKKAKIISSSEHGISEIKVRLHVKNRSGRIIRNIKIIDKYPKIVQVEDEVSLGSIKPTKMASTDKSHSLLLWNFDSLDPYEERLVIYKLRSQLNIVGNLSLPSSKVKFSTASGERTYFSNDVKLIHKSHKSLDAEDGE